MWKKYGDYQSEKKVIKMIYHLNFNMNYSFQQIIGVLDELGIKTRKGKSFQKSRIRLILNDRDYQTSAFLDKETLEKVREANKLMNIEEPKFEELKKAFGI